MLTGLLMAAGLAAQPAGAAAANEADIQCVAMLANMIGSQKGEANPQLVSGLLYFVGRIDGRAPGYDFEAAMRRLVAAPDAAKTVNAQSQRCSHLLQERGEMLTKIGNSLQGK